MTNTNNEAKTVVISVRVKSGHSRYSKVYPVAVRKLNKTHSYIIATYIRVDSHEEGNQLFYDYTFIIG